MSVHQYNSHRPFTPQFDRHTRGLKRTNEDAGLDIKKVSKRKPFGTCAEIVIIDCFNKAATNKIWMNQELAKQFSEEDLSSPLNDNYARLGDKIYMIGINDSLKNGMVGISHQQKEALSTSLFFHNNNKHIWLDSYSKNEPPIDLITITFKIRKYINGSNKLSTIILDTNLLSKNITKEFKNHIITLHQELLIAYNQERFILTVKKMKSQIKNFFGKITEKTNFKYITNISSQISLIKKVLSPTQGKAFFNVSLTHKKLKKDRINPVKIDIIKLQEKLFEILNGKPVLIEESTKLHLDSELSLLVKLTKIESEGKSYIFKELKSPQVAFNLTNKPKLIFSPSQNILLIRPKVYEATIIDLQLISKEDDPANFTPAKPLKWINISELQKQILSMELPLCESQILPLQLSNKKIFTKVLEAHDPQYIDRIEEENKGAVDWKIGEKTEIRFFKQSGFNMPLVDNEISIEAQEVCFHINTSKNKGNGPKIKIDEDELVKAIRTQIKTPFLKNQILTAFLSKAHVELYVNNINFKPTDFKPKYGILNHISESTKIKIVNSSMEFEIINTSNLISNDPIQKLTEYKLAALSEEFKSIIRAIYIHRVYNEQAQKLQLPFEKGLLLYGPTGNGKTKLGLALAEILGCGEKSGRLKQISGPEVLEKWVGSSEKNVRELFAPAIRDYEKLQHKSQLHIIFIDEVEGLLPKRKENNHKVDNNIVNQFLSLLDGTISLPNILVIGTTNNIKLIDPAVLRFGRLGKHIEIKAPTLEGRKSIFEVHSNHLKNLGRISPDVDFSALAADTNEFSGAEIAGVVSHAAQYSLERFFNLKLTASQCENGKEKIITKKDFYLAIEETKKKKELAGGSKPTYFI